MMRIPILLAALLLAGCGDNAPKDGALSADEERQLNEAAAMLDEPADGEAVDAGSRKSE